MRLGHIKLGKYRSRLNCRLCGSRNLVKFLDLGYMPHAGDFLTADMVGKENSYPLRIYYCKDCNLVQNTDVISRSTLFKDYHYLSSVSLSEHFQKYAEEIRDRFINKGSFVFEIGSNDGVLLIPLIKNGIRVLGIDPASNIAKIAKNKGVPTIVNYFGENIANKLLKIYGEADVISANNVLAHIDDMDDIFKGITKLLKPEGVLIFEVHYLPDLLDKMQYDFFYSEHLSYYCLLALKPYLDKFNLVIFDIKKIPIHSGSIRVYAMYKSNHIYKITSNVARLNNAEISSGYFNVKYLKAFANRVYKHRENIRRYLINIKKDGNRIVGYGASGRANTLLNFCGIDSNILDYIVDDSPERQGKFSPGTHIPIVSPDIFRADNVKHTLLLAWNYKDLIIKKEASYIKKGGLFILPLPKIEIIRE
jgi:methylation protein EvaC